jgi:NADPH:quinone reductase
MKVAGVEFSGVVEALGEGVKDYAVGDRVLGTTTGLERGANAEFVVVPLKSRMGVLAKLPESLPLRKEPRFPWAP